MIIIKSAIVEVLAKPCVCYHFAGPNHVACDPSPASQSKPRRVFGAADLQPPRICLVGSYDYRYEICALC